MPEFPKITELTLTQEKELRQYKARWTEIMCTTEPIDRKGFKEAIKQAYQKGGLKAPPIIYCSSPVTVEIVKAAQTDKSLGSKTDWEIIERKLVQEFGPKNANQVLENAKNSLKDCGDLRVGNTVIDDIWTQIWNRTGTLIRYVIDKKMRAKMVRIGEGIDVWNQIISTLFTGNVENTPWWRRYESKLPPGLISRACYPLPHFITYEFYREVLGLVNETALIKPLFDAMKSGSYFAPFRGICLASERPIRISVDNRGRLHSETEAAIEYADGVRTYALGGVSVTEKIIKHWETVTSRDIDRERNVEVRRILTEKYGFAKYIMESGAKLIQQDHYGELYRKDRSRWREEPVMMVKVRNSTPEPDGHYKDYFLRVKWDCETAHEGVASTFGKTPEEYHPLKET